jgi:flagellar biosynthesis/type III secretory pathway M-ring protein FliF/YscJ
VKKVRLPAGGIRKVSVAVLVDQGVSWVKEGSGYRRVLEPPAPEKLKVIRDLVAGIAGINADRGDQLIVETLPFETTLLTEPPQSRPASRQGTPSPAPFQLDRRMQIIAGAAAGSLVILMLFAFLLRRRRKPRQTAQATTPAALPPSPERPAPPAVEPPAPSVEQQLEAKLAERDEMQRRLDAQTLSSIKVAPVITKAAEVFARHLRDKIQQDPALSATILHSWIREDDN